MARFPLAVLLLVAVLLSALVCHSSAASCHIDTPWTGAIQNLSILPGETILGIILPAPHCQLVSAGQDTLTGQYGYFYALDVRNGSVLWQWPTVHAYNVQVQQLQRSSHSDRVYALLGSLINNETATVTMAALHANGTVLWQYNLTLASEGQAITSFAVMQPPLLKPALGERIVLAASPLYGHGQAVVLDGNTGRLLSSFNLSTVEAEWTCFVKAVSEGREGYFTLQPEDAWFEVHLYHLLPDGTVVNTTRDQGQVLVRAELYSQPALLHENSSSGSMDKIVVARDVVSSQPWWSSNDTFLVGTDWGSQGSFIHSWTVFHLLDANLFLVINAAYDTAQAEHNNTVVAQAGVYELSSGAQVSLSPLMIFYSTFATFDYPLPRQYGDVVVMDCYTGWYALQLPTLKLLKHVYWPAQANTAYLVVDPDGSYIAIDWHYHGLHNYTVSGSPPPNQSDSPAQQRLGEEVQHRHVRSE